MREKFIIEHQDEEIHDMVNLYFRSTGINCRICISSKEPLQIPRIKVYYNDNSEYIALSIEDSPQIVLGMSSIAQFYITQYLKKLQGWKPLENALCVELIFHVSIPSSWSKKKRMEAAQGVIRPTVRNGDLDNLIKCVLDSANGLLWADDCVITDLHAKKRYTAELARVEITVTEVQ